MDDPRATGRLRRATWPIGAFLIGLLLSNPPREGGTGGVLLIGALVGAFIALVAFGLAALMTERGPTKTYLPFNGETRGAGVDVIFAIAVSAALFLKLKGYWGVLPFAIGIIPIAIVMYGGRYLSKRTDPMSRQEMRAKLQEMADDPSTSDIDREGARARLRKLDKVEG